MVPDPILVINLAMTWAQTLGPGKKDGRRNNGGARVGAGRPISAKYRLMIEKHLQSEILVKEHRHGQIRYVKKTVLKAMLDQLSRQAIQHHDIRAARAYLNLTLGKPLTPSGKKPRYSKKAQLKAMAYSGVLF